MGREKVHDEIELSVHPVKQCFLRMFPSLVTARKVKSITVGLDGGVRRLDERCDLTVAIDGLEFDLTAYIAEKLGETEHGPLDAVS